MNYDSDTTPDNLVMSEFPADFCEFFFRRFFHRELRSMLRPKNHPCRRNQRQKNLINIQKRISERSIFFEMFNENTN